MTDAYILYGVLSARNFSSMIPRFRQNTTDCISVYYEMYVNKKIWRNHCQNQNGCN